MYIWQLGVALCSAWPTGLDMSRSCGCNRWQWPQKAEAVGLLTHNASYTSTHWYAYKYCYYCHINTNQLRDRRHWHHSANSSIPFVTCLRWLHLHIKYTTLRCVHRKRKMLTNVSRYDVLYILKLSEKKRRKKKTILWPDRRSTLGMPEMRSHKEREEKLSVNLTYA